MSDELNTEATIGGGRAGDPDLAAYDANALSIKLEVIVKQHGKVYRQTFERGALTTELEVIGKTKGPKDSGTFVRFSPDPEIFQETTTWNADVLRGRLLELSFLNKEVTLTFLNELAENEEGPQTEIFHHEKGIGAFVEHLNRN